jgi:hypothetical protein
VDTDIVKDKTYQYRVRAFSGPLAVNRGNTLDFPTPIFDNSKNEWVQRWPSSDPQEQIIMGRPSPIITGRVPTTPSDFDVITVLQYTFRMAFALGFHLDVTKGSTFDPTGLNTGNTPVSEIGKGSLTNLAGPLSQIIPAVTLGFVNPQSTSMTAGSLGGIGFSAQGISSATPDPTSGMYPDVTHNFFSVKAHSSRLAIAVGSALLETSAMIQSLKDLYTTPLPLTHLIPSKGNLNGVNTLSGLVYAFNKLPPNYPEDYDPSVYLTYSAAFSDQNTRLALLSAVRFIKSFTLVGTPPDWVSISLLRDIVPWSGSFMYDILNRIKALTDAFKSGVDEIKAFIDLLSRKVDMLEKFLKYLLELASYLDSFDAGFYYLALPSTTQGIPGWISAIDNATGTPPSSGPNGYTAGVALAYSAPDVTAFATAFSLIF